MREAAMETRHQLGRHWLLLLCVSVVIGTAEGAGLANPLYIDPAVQGFSANPKVLDRVRSGPHGYFRFINVPFSAEVCRRFRSSLAHTPSSNLHGDAHIEQYAITDLGRGLTDFDDSSTGPGFIDWLRFGVSVHLACRIHDWEDRADELTEEFLRGYRDALRDPELAVPEPLVVQRIRSTFSIDRKAYFGWVDSIMEPMPAEERNSLLIALQPYVEAMLAERPGLSREYFEWVKTGYLRMGIGSALDTKYLVRVRGETDDPIDDLVLECKQVRDLSGIDCVSSGKRSDAFRVLLGQARIAYQPFRHLGYFRFREHTFWVHSWVQNYKEVTIGESFRTHQELAEVVYDVGVQLGRGHVKHIATPFDRELRREQLEVLDRHEPEIERTCRELAEQTIAAWEMFCEGLDSTASDR